MALPNVTSWFRWSNTLQAWSERLGTLNVLAGLLLLWYFAGSLALWLQVMCWAALGLLLTFFWRRGWIRLCGPVFFYDLIRNGRRSRLFVTRLAYLSILFFLLGIVYLNVSAGTGFDQPMQRNEAAQLSLLFFTTFMSAQLFFVLVLTPAFTAGAITEEKERKILEFVLATDLRNREIIFGKLLSRMALLSLFILAGLPILSALQFMGGFSPLGLLAGFAITLLTLLSLASLSVLASVLARHTREALFLVYFIVLGYLGASVLAHFWLSAGRWNDFPSTPSWTSPITVADLLLAVRSGNPLFTVGGLFNSKGLDEDGIGAALTVYALFHGTVAIGCIGAAIGLLRWAGLREAAAPHARRVRAWLRPAVGRWPMVWKEVWLKGTGKRRWLVRFVLLLLVAFSLLPLVSILDWYYRHVNSEWHGASSSRYFDDAPWTYLGRKVNVWVRYVSVLVAMLGIASVGVRAATSVRGEHDRDTLTSLLTTPLSSEEILFGKWLGSLASMRWLAAWLGLVWGLGVAFNGLTPLALPLLALATLSYAATAASLGLWCSIVCRTNMHAIRLTLLLGILLMIGHWLPWLACFVISDNVRESTLVWFAKVQGALTPPIVLAGFLPMSPANLGDYYPGAKWNPLELMSLSFCGTVVWFLLAWIIWKRANVCFKLSGGRIDTVLTPPIPPAG